MPKKVGILGSGMVGEALANGFLKHGYTVKRGSRDPKKLEEWANGAGANASVGTFEETAKFGDIVVLAVKGSAAEAVIKLCGKGNLTGKTIIDTTNPISDKPPVNGVLRYFTDINESLMEKLQDLKPKAHFVKAFSCVGSAHMEGPAFDSKPTMFICGNDDGARKEVTEILTQFGWGTEDMGAVEAARAIEPLAILWCIPGFAQNSWNHALKLLKG